MNTLSAITMYPTAGRESAWELCRATAERRAVTQMAHWVSNSAKLIQKTM